MVFLLRNGGRWTRAFTFRGSEGERGRKVWPRTGRRRGRQAGGVYEILNFPNRSTDLPIQAYARRTTSFGNNSARIPRVPRVRGTRFPRPPAYCLTLTFTVPLIRRWTWRMSS